MSVALRQSRRFDASSPVTRYWVANCVGFAVTGGHRGVVEAVQAEDDPTRPETLRVRCGRHRTRDLPAAAVVSVVPSERVLVVEHVPGSVEVHGREAARVAGQGAAAGTRVLAAALARLCALGWTWACRGWAAARPRLERELRRGWRESRRLIASIPWHEFGRSARSATARARQEISTRSSRPRTTSSRTSSERSSRREADTTSST